jgi:CDP-glucose 4,6-dehydratase
VDAPPDVGPDPVTRVFVTGAHGLIGSWLVKALLARGDHVVVLVRGDRPRSALTIAGLAPTVGGPVPSVGGPVLSVGGPVLSVGGPAPTGDLAPDAPAIGIVSGAPALEIVPGGPVVELVWGDVRDGDLLERVLREHETELVFHLAGQAIVVDDGRSPGETFATNVGGTWALLEACRAAGSAPRVVVASSEKVYGASPAFPSTERSPLDPADPYAASKAAADVIARSYWHAYGLPVAVARLGNVYGGGDMNPSRLVPGAVWAALAGRQPLIRSDGTARRDFLHVDDAVAAYLAIADLLVDPTQAAGLAFNVGSGTRPTVREIVRHVFAAAAVPLDPDTPGRVEALGEFDSQSVDHSRLTQRTGWRPEVGLADGLRRTVAWYSRHAPTPPPEPGVSPS